MRERLDAMLKEVREERDMARLQGSALRVVVWRQLEEALVLVLETDLCD